MIYTYNGILLDHKERNDVLIHITSIDLENITLSEINPMQKDQCMTPHLREIPRIGKFIEAKSRLEVIRE